MPQRPGLRPRHQPPLPLIQMFERPRIGCGSRGRRRWRRVEAVGAEAGAGEEADPAPFAELGEHVAGLDLQQHRELVAAPVTRRFAGDDGSDELAPGRWLRRPGLGGRVAAWPAGAERRRDAHGDVDGGDGSGGAGPAVVAVEVAGRGALDLAGAEPGPPGRQQGRKNSSADDAGQVSGAGRDDAARGGEFLPRRLQRAGEAGPVGIGAWPGLDSGDHRHPQQLIEGQHRPQLLLHPGPVTGAQHAAVQQGVAQGEERRFDLVG